MTDRILDPSLADPFEPYRQVVRDKRRLQVLQVVQFAIMLVLAVGLFLTAMRPPHVIVKDRISGEAPAVSRMTVAPDISEQDARVFFINMLKLRYGWSSLTVQRDLQSYMSQCLSTQRRPEEEHFHELVSGADGGPRPHRRRLETWIVEGIHNTLVLPEDLAAIRCSAREDGAWVCTSPGSVITQRQIPPFLSPAPTRRMVFLATLFPVRHTIHTPYGLVVARLQNFDPPGSSPAPS